jgi:hypothetical protein
VLKTKENQSEQSEEQQVLTLGRAAFASVKRWEKAGEK